MTKRLTTKYRGLFRWGAFIGVVLLFLSVVLLVPLTRFGDFAPAEFWIMLMVPNGICAYHVLVKRHGLSEWPIFVLSGASAWYVWFALLSMVVEPTESEVGFLIAWICTGTLTLPVFYKLVATLRHNRCLLALAMPLIISMSVGFLHFFGEFTLFTFDIDIR